MEVPGKPGSDFPGTSIEFCDDRSLSFVNVGCFYLLIFQSTFSLNYQQTAAASLSSDYNKCQ
jgi:hypothetical protein